MGTSGRAIECSWSIEARAVGSPSECLRRRGPAPARARKRGARSAPSAAEIRHSTPMLASRSPLSTSRRYDGWMPAVLATTVRRRPASSRKWRSCSPIYRVAASAARSASTWSFVLTALTQPFDAHLWLIGGRWATRRARGWRPRCRQVGSGGLRDRARPRRLRGTRPGCRTLGVSGRQAWACSTARTAATLPSS
jgi:hypothetical protein